MFYHLKICDCRIILNVDIAFYFKMPIYKDTPILYSPIQVSVVERTVTATPRTLLTETENVGLREWRRRSTMTYIRSS